MKTCVVIYNPNSGHTLNKDNLKLCKKYLSKFNYLPKFIPTKYAGHAKEIVSHLDKVDVVFSIGGDGTFNEVVTGNLLRKDRLIVCHIPVGTTNDVGKMFGYTKNFQKNLLLALNGEVKKIDICSINDRPFVYVAGLGKFVTVAYETPRYLKKKIGYLAYLIEGIKDFFKPVKLYNLTYEINGIEKTGYYSFMLISNANRIAGINNFYKELLSRKEYLDNKIKNNPSIKSDYDNILNEINEDTMCFEHLIKREEPILFIKDKDNFYEYDNKKDNEDIKVLKYSSLPSIKMKVAQ